MAKSLKTSYNIHHQVESFFTGSQLQFDNDGLHFYCANGSSINKVCIEDGQVSAQITTKNEEDSVIRFTLSPNNELIIIAYHSGLITKFNLLNDTIEREFKSLHSAPISFLKINQSNTLLATASSDGTIKLWNLDNHYCSHNLKGVNGVISCVEFHQYANDELLFCSAGDDSIHIFDIESRKRLAKLVTHCSTVTDLKVLDDGDKLLSVGRDKIACVWDISRLEKKKYGSIIRTIPLYESIESVVILDSKSLSTLIGQVDDGHFIATIGEEGLIKIWSLETGAKLFTQNEHPLSGHRSPGVHCFQLLPRPKHDQICAVSNQKDIFLYSLPHLDLIQQLQGHIDEILSACWFAKNKYLAIASNSNDLKIMEVSTSKTQQLKGHNDIVLCVRSVPTNPFCVISSSKDCTVNIWMFNPDDMSSTIIYKATGHTHAVNALAVLGGEEVFFSCGQDTTLKRWSFRESRKERSQKTTTSSSSSTIPLIANQTIKAHEDRIDDLAVSPNDQLVATGSKDKTAKIFSTENLQILATLKGHRRGIHSIKFSPVDQVVVTAGDSTLRMWNLNDFTCVKIFQGHDCAVLNFDFLSSGLQLLSMGSDGNMKLWDCKTNECLKTIDAHQGSAWTLSITGDDNFVVTGGQDEKLIIWRDTTSEDHEEKLVNLQTQVVQEQDFMNYISKKKWRKAFKIALKMENPTKTLNVLREILLEPEGTKELEELLINLSLPKLDFIIECCVGWCATARTSSIAHQILTIIIRNFNSEQLLKMPNLISSMEQLKILTEKSYNRYERLTQEANFVDFFASAIRIQ